MITIPKVSNFNVFLLKMIFFYSLREKKKLVIIYFIIIYLFFYFNNFKHGIYLLVFALFQMTTVCLDHMVLDIWKVRLISMEAQPHTAMVA